MYNFIKEIIIFGIVCLFLSVLLQYAPDVHYIWPLIFAICTVVVAAVGIVLVIIELVKETK